jgi:hypothetical protein
VLSFTSHVLALPGAAPMSQTTMSLVPSQVAEPTIMPASPISPIALLPVVEAIVEGLRGVTNNNKTIS